MKQKLRVLDLFSGIGGFSLGLERTGGFETVAFCEIEEFPRRVLAKHWPEVPCYHDVTKLTGDILARDGIAVDVITGGFPCQDLSVAGKQAGMGEGTRSGLWSEIVRLIGDLRPSYVIVENVANLLSGPSEKRGGWFSRVLGDLAECGYDAEWENISAQEVGAPQRRERIWIAAYPEKRLRNRVLFSGKFHGESSFQGFKRVRRSVRLRRDRHEPPANFARLSADDGISLRVGEIAAYGNAVVPQIPELIGQAILKAEAA